MNNILLSNLCKRRGSTNAGIPRAAAWLLPGFAAVAGLLVWAGYEVGVRQSEHRFSESVSAELRQILREERALVDSVRSEQRNHLDALALRIGEMQAHMMRLDALGDRLVGIGKLDRDEFDFSEAPAVGGVAAAEGVSQEITDLNTDLERLDSLLQDREIKLTVLEEQLLGSELLREVMPSGRPVKKGWISSLYGRRTDPFTGKKTYHRGIDFAGKRGTEVFSVAAGVVKRSRKTAGYGNLIEIRHPDGFTTLYAHNKENLVKTGDVVDKGQLIALLGSTGRSSGPHVHFEVHKDGKIVDPRRYIRAP